jgi:hypothetical protein
VFLVLIDSLSPSLIRKKPVVVFWILGKCLVLSAWPGEVSVFYNSDIVCGYGMVVWCDVQNGNNAE